MKTRKPIRAVFALMLAVALLCGSLPTALAYRTDGDVVTLPDGGTYYLYDYVHEGDFEVRYVNSAGTRLTAAETDSTYGVSIRGIQESYYLSTAGCLYIPDTYRGYPVVRIEKADKRNHYIGIRIPASVREIADPAFSNCPYLEWIEVDENNPYFYSVDGVLYKGNQKTEQTSLVCYPQAKKDESFITYPGAQAVNDKAFYGNSFLRTLTIAAGQTGVAVGEIRDCASLETLIFGEGAFSLDYFPVSNCPALQTIHFSDLYLFTEPMPFLDSVGVSGLTVCSAAYTQSLETAAQIAGCTYCVCGSAHTYAQQDDPSSDQPQLPDDPTPDVPTLDGRYAFWFSPYYQRDAQGNIVKDENGASVQLGYSVIGTKEKVSEPVRVTIPPTYKGLPVLEISAGFGFTFDELTAVHIPSTVQFIGQGAFAHHTALREITVDADSAYFKAVDNVLYTADGKELIAYAAAKTDASFAIPEGTERLADSTVAWSPSLREISVPSTFTDGQLVATLKKAQNLRAAHVDAANPVLCSDAAGVLYNKDQTALLLYPPYGPADYTLPQSVTEIADRSLSSKTLRTLRIADGVTQTPIAGLSSLFYQGTGAAIRLHIPESVTEVRFIGSASHIRICCTTRASQAAAYAAANGMTFLICNADHTELREPTDDDPPAPPLSDEDTFDFYYVFGEDENGVTQFTGIGILGLTQTPDDTFTLTIPAQYRGLPVREVNFSPLWAQAHGAKVTTIALPQTVETLEGVSDAVTDYFVNLRQITVHGANPYLRSVGGVLFNKAMTTLILYPAAKTVTTYAIPAGVETFADNRFLFCGNTYLQHLTLPASFTEGKIHGTVLGTLRKLPALQSVTVDPENETFASDECGVLFSADRKTLFFYPPAASAEVYTVPASVEEFYSNSIGNPAHLRVLCISDDAVRTPSGRLTSSAPQYVHIPSTVRYISLTVNNDYQKICSDSVDSPAAAYAKQEGLDFLLCDGTHTHFTPVDPDEIAADLFDFSYITEQDADGVTRYTGVRLKGLKTAPAGLFPLMIPETYFGLPVLQVDFLFWPQTQKKYITRIDLPKTVQSLEGFPDGTPKACENLMSITVDAANPYFRAVDGVLFSKDLTTLIWYPAAKTNASYAIPEGVCEVDRRDAFADNIYLQHLSLPASFTDFGTAMNYCFSGLRNLRSFSVAAGNPTYSSDENGVLYNEDKTTMILYPCANEAEKYTIPASVTRFGFYSPTYYPQNLRVLCIADGVTRAPSLSIRLGDSVQVLHIPSSVQYITGNYGLAKIDKSVTICSDSADSAAAQFASSWGYAFEVCTDHSPGTTPVDPPDDPPVEPTEPIALTVSGGTAKPGDIVRVTVDLTKNTGIIALRMHLGYDPSVLTLTGVQDGGLLETASFVAGKDLSAVPYTVLWEDALTHTNHTATGTLVTYTFRVSEDAEAGTTPVTVMVDENSTYNVDLQNVACAITNGIVTVNTRTAGDANGDGILDLRDVVLLRRFLAGGWDVTVETKNMDVDGDGVLSLKDSTLLSRFLAGGWNVTLK